MIHPRNPLYSGSTVSKVNSSRMTFPRNAFRFTNTGRQTGARLKPAEVYGVALRGANVGSSNGLSLPSSVITPVPTSSTDIVMMSKPLELGFTLSISNHVSKRSVAAGALAGIVKSGDFKVPLLRAVDVPPDFPASNGDCVPRKLPAVGSPYQKPNEPEKGAGREPPELSSG